MIHEGSLLFVVGPVSVYLAEAREQTILDAYAEIGKYVAVAAKQLEERYVRNPGIPHVGFPGTAASDLPFFPRG